MHTLACYPLAAFGSDAQREELLPDMLGGELLGAYCLSEPQGGSDAAALTTKAVLDGDDYVVTGTKAWITHAGIADFYNIFARTGGPGAAGISCLLAPAATPGINPLPRERTMGLRSSPIAQIAFDGARVPAESAHRRDGHRFPYRDERARLGPSRHRRVRRRARAGRPRLRRDLRRRSRAVRQADLVVPRHRLHARRYVHADLARPGHCTLDAARLRDAGRPYSVEAAKAKLFATDMAMKVTTDAVQVLGGYGYVSDHPVERYMREAKVLQIVEGTNQIQRLVISRSLGKG